LVCVRRLFMVDTLVPVPAWQVADAVPVAGRQWPAMATTTTTPKGRVARARAGARDADQ